MSAACRHALAPAVTQATPGAPPSAWNWPAALAGQFVFVFSAVALSGPGRIDIVDGQTRYEVARSLVEHGDSVIRDGEVWFRVHTGRDGDRYTAYRFPQSGLGAVAIALADATGPVSEPRRHFFFSLIGAAAAAALAVTYALWFRRLGHGAAAALLWATLGIFCTPSWYYGTSSFDDVLGAAAVVMAVAAAFLGRDGRPWLGAAVAAVCLAWAVNCKEPLGLFALPAAAALYRPGVPLRRQLGPMALVLAGVALGAAACKAYDLYKFPPGTSDPNAEYEAVFGAMWTANPVPGLLGLAFSPSAGILWYCPTVFLSLAGWLAWRRRLPWFCAAVAAAAVLLVGFLSFLTFFKGEPCWGPRYLTPLLALAWVFVPASVGCLRRRLVVWLLGLGACVQLLGLAIDPHRLLLDRVIPFNYYVSAPWLQFNPQASHLFQRPREIVAAARAGAAPEYSPGALPTCAPTVPPPFPPALAGALGEASSPLAPRALALLASVRAGGAAHTERLYQDAARRYHVFASFRPWWVSHRHLPAAERPIDWHATLFALLAAAGLGLAAMAAGRRAAAGRPADLPAHNS